MRGATGVADVLLTHSYHLYFDRKQTRKMRPYPPLGTLYAAALLQRFGISVAVFDTMLNDPAEGFRSALEQHRPKIVVVYEDSFNFLSKMCLTRMREVAYDILDDRDRTRFPRRVEDVVRYLDASRKAGAIAI